MNSHLRGIVLLVLVTAIWGSTFAVVKTLNQLLDPPVLIAWRFLIGALALLPIVFWPRVKPTSEADVTVQTSLGSRALWRDALIIGVWLIAGYGTQTIALQTTGANRAAFFTALSVVLVPVWLVLAQRRKMPLALWLALPLAVGGLALLSWEGGALVIGDLWALVCALTYAGFIITLERLAHRHAPLPFTLAQVSCVAGLACVWALIAAPHHLLPPSAAWGPLVYLGVLATALTTLMQTLGQRHVSAAEASLIYTLEPVTATIFSYFLIHEQVGAWGLLGGVLVVIATIFSTQGSSIAPSQVPVSTAG